MITVYILSQIATYTVLLFSQNTIIRQSNAMRKLGYLRLESNLDE